MVYPKEYLSELPGRVITNQKMDREVPMIAFVSQGHRVESPSAGFMDHVKKSLRRVTNQMDLPVEVQQELDTGVNGMKEFLMDIIQRLQAIKPGDDQTEIRRLGEALSMCVVMNVQGVAQFAPRTVRWIIDKLGEL